MDSELTEYKTWEMYKLFQPIQNRFYGMQNIIISRKFDEKH